LKDRKLSRINTDREEDCQVQRKIARQKERFDRYRERLEIRGLDFQIDRKRGDTEKGKIDIIREERDRRLKDT